MKSPLFILKRSVALIGCLFFFAINLFAQDASSKKSTASDIKQLLESKEYIFKAQSVTPLRGGFKQLTSEYDLRMLGDSLVSYLPYWGRAYSAPLDPKESGIQFTSTKFDYELKANKKGWDITFKPTDVSSVQQMILNVTSSGRATLQVTSTNREPISFNGVVVSRH